MRAKTALAFCLATPCLFSSVRLFAAQPVLESWVLDEAGTLASTAAITVLSAGGQALTGSVRDDTSALDWGFLLPIAAAEPTARISAVFEPSTLNLKSQGQYVTLYLEVTGPKSASDIEPTSIAITAVNGVALSTPIAALQEDAGKSGKTKGAHLGDYDQDDIPDLQVKFDRQALIAVLHVDDQVSLTVQGRFSDDSSFLVDGYIRTIQPGTIKVSEGGTKLHSGGRAQARFPAGALAQDTEVSIVRISAMGPAETGKRSAAAAAATLVLHGRPFEFGPAGAQFSRPVAVVLPYEPADLPQGMPASSLKIAYWNPDKNAWEPLPSIVDEAAKFVSAQTSHFSEYQVAGDPSAPAEGLSPAADAGFSLHEVYVFPSPARRGEQPTFHMEAGIADSARLRIYDLTGRLRHEVSINAAPQLIDSGKGLQYAYEYTWQSDASSGIYFYVMTAEKSGSRLIYKGKFAIVR